MISLGERFDQALLHARARYADDPSLVPMMVVHACAEVLQVEGAGLSTVHGLRVPLGSSNESVAMIEQIQTTLGDGPCLAAAESMAPVVADLMTIRDRWPCYHHELVAKTRFRSVASFPLTLPGQPRFAALDVYALDPSGFALWATDNIQAEVVDPAAELVAASLYAGSDPVSDVPSWLDTDPVKDRLTVWIAMGMVMAEQGSTNTSALAVLRRHAQQSGTTLDQLAAQLVSREVDLDSLT